MLQPLTATSQFALPHNYGFVPTLSPSSRTCSLYTHTSIIAPWNCLLSWIDSRHGKWLVKLRLCGAVTVSWPWLFICTACVTCLAPLTFQEHGCRSGLGPCCHTCPSMADSCGLWALLWWLLSAREKEMPDLLRDALSLLLHCLFPLLLQLSEKPVDSKRKQ